MHSTIEVSRKFTIFVDEEDMWDIITRGKTPNSLRIKIWIRVSIRKHSLDFQETAKNSDNLRIFDSESNKSNGKRSFWSQYQSITI